MSSISMSKKVLLVTAFLALPSTALAQNQAVTDQANEVAEQANKLADETNQLNATVAEEAQAASVDDGRNDAGDADHNDGDEGKWGLLGLLGLAGLLGLKRHDREQVQYRGSATADRTQTGSGTDRR